jgi:heme-degrading monooxygenase HmoA
MILEAAMLKVKPEEQDRFEEAFRKASQIIASAAGHLSHELHKCVEMNGKYLLLVRWRVLEDHTLGFRRSAAYEEWKRLLHHFYDPFPRVEYFTKVETLQNQ